MSGNNTVYIKRKKQVIEVSKQNKSTRYIAEALKMSLRDIGLIRKTYGINSGIVMTTDSNKSTNVKATQAYELYDKGNNPHTYTSEICISKHKTYYMKSWS